MGFEFHSGNITQHKTLALKLKKVEEKKCKQQSEGRTKKMANIERDCIKLEKLGKWSDGEYACL